MITDSPRRCPRDSKRMVYELGQDEDTGRCRGVHVCWHCNFREEDRAWPAVPVVLAEIGQGDGAD